WSAVVLYRFCNPSRAHLANATGKLQNGDGLVSWPQSQLTVGDLAVSPPVVVPSSAPHPAFFPIKILIPMTFLLMKNIRKLAVLASFSFTFAMSLTVGAYDLTQDKVLYAVGYGHLDDQWNWTIQDSINSYIPKTLHQNFVYFTNAAFTNFNFSFEGALRYEFIQEYYPTDFLTLSNYIAQGRWHVAGSSLTPSDVNIPAPESLIRHTLYADQFWKRTFGRTSTDFLLPDAFGFGYALPSVAAHCGV